MNFAILFWPRQKWRNFCTGTLIILAKGYFFVFLALNSLLKQKLVSDRHRTGFADCKTSGVPKVHVFLQGSLQLSLFFLTSRLTNELRCLKSYIVIQYCTLLLTLKKMIMNAKACE